MQTELHPRVGPCAFASQMPRLALRLPWKEYNTNREQLRICQAEFSFSAIAGSSQQEGGLWEAGVAFSACWRCDMRVSSATPDERCSDGSCSGQVSRQYHHCGQFRCVSE